MIIALAFYGGLAALAVASTWRVAELRCLGIALLAGFLLSNLAHFALSFDERPAAFTVIEIGISLCAFIARTLGAPRAMVAIISISVLSVTANIAISLYDHPSLYQIHVWEGITNLCYIGECLLASGAGIYAGGWNGGLHRWFDRDRGHVASARNRAD